MAGGDHYDVSWDNEMFEVLVYCIVAWNLKIDITLRQNSEIALLLPADEGKLNCFLSLVA